MRAVLGIAGATVLLTFAGAGVLRAAGVVGRSRSEILSALGLAYLTGIALVMTVGLALLTLGVTFRLSVFAAVSVLAGLAGLLIARRRAPSDARVAPPARAGDGLSVPIRRAFAVLAVCAAGYLVIWLLTYVVTPIHAWDGWSIWGRKGMILATSEGLPERFFTADPYAFMHQDYPLLLPLLESVYFRAMGAADTEAIHAVFWLMAVAFAGALAFVISSTGRARVWVAVTLGAVLAPLVYGQLSNAYADVPMGFFLGLGTLLLARWTVSRRAGELALAGLFLAAAAATKNEGVAAALAGLAAAALVIPRPRRPGLAALGFAAAGIAAALAPWRIWTAANGVEGDLPLARGLEPGYLVDRLDRLLPTLKALIPELPKQGGWLVPAAVLVVGAAIVTGMSRRLAVFYVLAGVGTFASVVWSFLITRETLDYQIATSADRLVVGVVFVAAAALAHLGGVLDIGAGREPTAPERGPS